jgi:hypothetical protein
MWQRGALYDILQTKVPHALDFDVRRVMDGSSHFKEKWIAIFTYGPAKGVFSVEDETCLQKTEC